MWSLAALFVGYFAGYMIGRLDRWQRIRLALQAPAIEIDDEDLDRRGRLKRWNERRQCNSKQLRSR